MAKPNLPKNDEGEFELVLGNRQLISVLVIVAALLGVFCSMGYIVGRNSSPAGAAEVARASAPASNDSAPLTTPPSSTQPGKPAVAPPAVHVG